MNIKKYNAHFMNAYGKRRQGVIALVKSTADLDYVLDKNILNVAYTGDAMNELLCRGGFFIHNYHLIKFSQVYDWEIIQDD